MPYSLCPTPKVRFWNAAGTAPLAGGKVYFYQQGTSTPKDTYTDNTGATPNQNPVILDANGEAAIWLSGFYKIVLKDSSDVTQWTVDNVSSMPADSSTAYSEWLSNGLTPTYISVTSFSVPGDETARFHLGRRVKCVVSAGTVYGTIKATSYASSVTTVTVTLDSGDLDSGLSSVSESVISASNTSAPALYACPIILTTTQRDTFTGVNGMFIFNSTVGRHQVRRGAAWYNVVDPDSTDTMTNKTLTSPVLTSPKIANTDYIVDGNGVAILQFNATASAVNRLAVANAATGNGPSLVAVGSDTNIDIVMVPKGTGVFKPGRLLGAWDSASYSIGTAYQAASDTIIQVEADGGGAGLGLAAYTDSSNPPTTLRMEQRAAGGAGWDYVGITFVCKKGDYFKVAATAGAAAGVTYSAIPLG